MALQGTLEDLGIIDLVQFPHAGRKTGELIINSNGRQARLYYEKGSLIHASLGDAAGIEALVRVVDWTEGAFEFMATELSVKKNIELDLHRAVMQALKIHDELKEAELRRKAERKPAPQITDEALSTKLSEFVSSNDFAVHACVFGQDGALKAASISQSGAHDAVQELWPALQALLIEYPDGALNKAYIIDETGTVVLMKLGNGDSLVVTATKEASLGAISVNVGRLAADLN
jgi:predicted regulator of Ras-like GTPase activity (Roadblock/LC7/MglB family)